MAFTKLSDPTKPRHVVDQVLQSIQDGSLKAGERLPSEAKLAELTGVGRTSVREALAALRLMGVIETRVGAGSYIAASLDGSAMSSDIANEIAAAISASEEALQLQEARAVFEAGMVRLAAQRWSPEKAKEFEQLLSRMTEAAESEGYTHYIQLHRDFHLLLAQVTDNAVVESTARSFLEFMDHEGWQDMERQFYLPNRAEILRESVDLHRGIVDALASGDGALASQRVHDHFQRYEEGGNGG
jgi:GntR family transcriptional repressor for pyruvate dehydrogenase complex